MTIIGIIANVVNCVGSTINMIGINIKDKRKVLLFFIFGNICVAIASGLLNAMAGMLIQLVFVIETIINYFWEKKHDKYPMWMILIYIIIPCIMLIISYKSMWDFLPIIGGVLFPLALLSKDLKLRVLNLFSVLVWIPYNFHIGQYVGFVSCIIFAIMNFIAIVRLDILNKKFLENKKVIIFDLDGTLVDSVNMFNEIYASLIKKMTGKAVDADQIQEDWDIFAHQKTSGDLYDNFLIYLDKKYSSESHDLETMRKMYSDIEYEYLTEKIEYKKYAKDVILKLKEKGYILALATLSPKKVLDIYNNINQKLINEFKIYDVFDLVLTYDDVKEKKPNPEVYLKIVEKLNVSKDKCLILEDSLEGVKAAINAEIEVLNIVDENMYKTQSTIDNLSTYKLNSFKELLKLL